MTRKLALLNWFLGAIQLGLVYYLSQMDPLPPTEADLDGSKPILFFIYVFVTGALFSFAIGIGLWFRSTGLWRVTFWIAILAAGFFSLLIAIFVTISHVDGVVYLPLLASLAPPLISVLHLNRLIRSAR